MHWPNLIPGIPYTPDPKSRIQIFEIVPLLPSLLHCLCDDGKNESLNREILSNKRIEERSRLEYARRRGH